MHTSSTSDACETHAQPVEKSITSLALRLRWHVTARTMSNYFHLGTVKGLECGQAIATTTSPEDEGGLLPYHVRCGVKSRPELTPTLENKERRREEKMLMLASPGLSSYHVCQFVYARGCIHTAF